MMGVKLALVTTLLALAAPTCLHDCRVSPAGVEFVKKREGYFPFIYADAVGYKTIGYGHALKRGEVIQQPLLGQAADDLLFADLAGTAQAVNHLVLVPLHQPQFDAIASFTFNVGVGKKGVKDGFGVLKSGRTPTILALINAGRHADVPVQFLYWASAGGKPLKGLAARRKAEAEMYASGASK